MQSSAKFVIPFLLLISFSMITSANEICSKGSAPENLRLKEIYDKDQSERMNLMPANFHDKDEFAKAQSKVFANDKPRYAAAMEVLRRNEFCGAVDYWRAAFIFQHGDNVEDIRLAYSMAVMASTLDPNEKKYRWIQAAAWDRILKMKNQPQWYGTQFQPNKISGAQELAPVQSGIVTDEERKFMGVPTLDESNEMIKSYNGKK